MNVSRIPKLSLERMFDRVQELLEDPTLTPEQFYKAQIIAYSLDDFASYLLLDLKQRCDASLKSLVCKECSRHCGMYMLKPAIWHQICPDYTEKIVKSPRFYRHYILCLSCAEYKLGRPFVRSDFTEAPVNDVIFHFLKH